MVATSSRRAISPEGMRAAVRRTCRLRTQFAHLPRPCLGWISSRPTARRSSGRSATRASTLDLDALIALDAEVRAPQDRDRPSARRAQRGQREVQGRRARREGRARPPGEGSGRARRASLKSELGDKEAALEVAADAAFPTFPTTGAPVGPDESFNTVVRTEGEPPKFDFEPLDHVALIEKNDWADLSRIDAGVGLAHLLPQGAAGAARDQADGLGAGQDRQRRLHADHRAGDRARAGVPQPGPVPRPRGGNLSSCPTTICGSRAPPRSR